ncbi:MAG: Hsp33 family molecular chaperone HslO, partial [Mariprofundaceae bacterium]
MAEPGTSEDARLIRFLLTTDSGGAPARGALVVAPGLVRQAAEIHGLSEPVATLFGQTLIGAALLLSIAKGGVRQVLQIDGREDAPIRRMLAEVRSGRVRG